LIWKVREIAALVAARKPTPPVLEKMMEDVILSPSFLVKGGDLFGGE
jgi:hypothetical protein